MAITKKCTNKTEQLVREELSKYLNISELNSINELVSSDTYNSFKGLEPQDKAVINYQPSVYLQAGTDGIYVGETMNLISRFKNHANINQDDSFNIFSSRLFNKSAIYEIESKILSFIGLSDIDGLVLKNSKLNQTSFNFYMKEVYELMANHIWDNIIIPKDMLQHKLPKSNVLGRKLENVLSPFLNPTETQWIYCNEIINRLKQGDTKIAITGDPGTGKTVVATLIVKQILINYGFHDGKLSETNGKKRILLTSGNEAVMNAALVDVFKWKLFGKSNVLISTKDVDIKEITDGEHQLFVLSQRALANLSLKMSKKLDEFFDVVVIDESHRLRKKADMTQGAVYKAINQEGGMYNLMNRISKNIILFHDENQILKMTDASINLSDYFTMRLDDQLRMRNAGKYIEFLNILFGKQNKSDKISKPGKNEFQFNIKYKQESKEAIEQLKDNSLKYLDVNKRINKSNDHNCRVIATYSIKWDKNKKDIQREGFMDQFGIDFSYNTSHQDKWYSTDKARNMEECGIAEAFQGIEVNELVALVGKNIVIKDNHIYSNYLLDGSSNKNYHDKNDLSNNNKLALNRLWVMLTRPKYGITIVFSNKEVYEFAKNIIEW